MSAGSPHGLIAEFADAEAMTSAVRAAVAAGWARMEAYAPFPVPEAAEALGVRAALVGWIAAGLGLAGAATTFAAQWWLAVHDYPLNIGGRPPFAWPVFLPATYIVGVLSAAAAALLGMLLLNRLPRLHHPVFYARGFHRASEDRYFLCLHADDPMYDRDRAESFLRGLSPLRVSEVRAS